MKKLANTVLQVTISSGKLLKRFGHIYSHSMYLILLHYKSDLITIDSFVPEHTKFLQKNYELGNFLMSGRRIPRTGGVIVARAENEEEVWAIIREDPFYINGVSEYEIIPFIASMTAPDLASYQETIPV